MDETLKTDEAIILVMAYMHNQDKEDAMNALTLLIKAAKQQCAQQKAYEIFKDLTNTIEEYENLEYTFNLEDVEQLKSKHMKGE
jgi:hypothetical protein